MYYISLYIGAYFYVLHAKVCVIIEGLDGGSWYSLITKNLAIYSLSLKFGLIH